MRRAFLAVLAAIMLVLPSYALAHGGGGDDPHQNETGQGHDNHKGYGWGHHCRVKKLICKCYKHKKHCRWRWALAPCPEDAGPDAAADAGTSEPDTGTPQADGGTPQGPDAGVPQDPDTGTPSEPDAGSPQGPDAGTPGEPDTGSPQEPDAGTPGTDADVPRRPDAEPPSRQDAEPPQRPDTQPPQKHDASPSRDSTVTAILDGGSTIPPVFSRYDGGEPPCTCDDDTELQGGGCSMGGNAGLGGTLLVLLLAAAFFMRKRLKILAGLAVLALLLLPGAARADGLTLSVPGLSPAASPYAYYKTDSAAMLGHGGFSTQVMLNYGRYPLTLHRSSDGSFVSNVIRGRLEADVLLAVGLFDRIELGFGLPVTLLQQDGDLAALRRTQTLKAGLGDLRFSPKVLLVGGKHLALSVLGTVTIPSARRSQLLGTDPGVTFTPTLLATLLHSRFDLSINLGVRIRDGKAVRYNSQEIDINEELVGGLGLRIPILKHRLDAIGDIAFAVSATSQDPEEKAFEFLGGLRAYLPKGFTVNAAAGAGLSRGIGTPAWRVLAGVGWTYETPPPKPCPPTIIERIRHVPVIRYVRYPVIKKVTVVKNTIFLPPVYFATDKDTVLPQSTATLDRVVELLKEHAWVKKVMVEGHADYRASDAYNLDLSKRRAQSVYRYLLSKGISADRLDQIGYGEGRPAAPGKDKASLAKNRRVEFVVVEPKQP